MRKTEEQTNKRIRQTKEKIKIICLEKKIMKKFFAFFIVLFLFGCFGQSPQPQENLTKEDEFSKLLKIPQLKNQTNQTNQTQENVSEIINHGKGQEDKIGEKLGEQEINIPRYLSEKIYDGDFDLLDQFEFPLQIHFIDAGFADSILIKKGRFIILIDDGNEEKVHSYLKNLMINNITILVVSNDRPEGIAGIPKLLDEFEIGEIWIVNSSERSAMHEMIENKAQRIGIPIKRPKTPDKLSFSGLEILVLNPKDTKGNALLNSIILKIKNNEFCAVFLNPAYHELQPDLISSIQENNLSVRCDVMTYFNHGEARASAPPILDYIQPKDVIILVGQNSDGYPNHATLTLLNIREKNIYRTDMGTIILTNNGSKEYQIKQDATAG